jgi:hypothetical protein
MRMFFATALRRWSARQLHADPAVSTDEMTAQVAREIIAALTDPD